MNKHWIGRVTILGAAVFTLAIAGGNAEAQSQKPVSPQQAQILTQEGEAIHNLVTLQLPDREIRKLVTSAATARVHPDLAEYYRSEAQRLQQQSERYERFARSAGDPFPLDVPNHFGISRTARFDYLVARDSLRKAQEAKVLAALHDQAARKQGCFTCHSFYGQGGKVAPDLAMEGTRHRSNAWLVGHFKDPQARSPKSLMPAFSSLPDRQLETLVVFLQRQREKLR